MKMRYLFLSKVFSNFEQFMSNLGNGTSSIEFVFSIYFLTVRPNAANDMALENLEMQNFLVYIISPNYLLWSQL